MIRVVVVVLGVAGCGRFGFDPRGDSQIGASIDALDGTAADVLIPNGLVAWFPLDDDIASGTAHDQSGHGHDASCTSCPAMTAGPHAGGTAASFNGSSNFLTFVPNAELMFAAGYSAVAWVNSGRVPGDFDSILAAPEGGASGNAYQLDIPNTDGAEYYTTNNDLYATSSVGIGIWHHLAATWDGITKRLYFDGVIESMTTPTGVLVDASPIVIGCDVTNGTPDHFFLGSIADVRLYNRTLSAPEIAALAVP